jgi:hypothetical protein
MLVIFDKQAISQRYGAQDAAVLQAVADLGETVDVSNLAPSQIRATINQRPKEVPALLIGDYGLLPTFRMDNPTQTAEKQSDEDVLTDAPYGARPGSTAEFYLPSRAVSRLPDSGIADAAGFVALLQRAKSAPDKPTPQGSFEQAAAEFNGAAQMVHDAMQVQLPIRLSPPDQQGAPALEPLVSGRGRIHILLHGSRDAADRDSLWGRAPQASKFVRAVSAVDLRGFDLDGALVSFSSCYGAMLDSTGNAPARTADNQVALACLAAGAKAIYGCTRANWIDTQQPFDSFGTALIAAAWNELRAGKPAAEALRRAKRIYATAALQSNDGWTRPYILKTLLQTHCFGHPLAKL